MVKKVHPAARVFDRATERMRFRSKAQVERFFDGLEIVPPYEGAR